MDSFKIKFQHLTTIELLKIASLTEEYQPEAIRAAESILDERGATEAEKVQASTQVHEIRLKRKIEKCNTEEGATAKYSKANNPANSNRAKKKTKKNIWWIGAIIMGLWLFMVVNFFPDFSSSGTDSEALLYYFFSIIPFLLLLIGNVLFLSKKKTGWYLLSVFLSYNLTEMLLLVYYSYVKLDELPMPLGIAPRETNRLSDMILLSVFALLLVLISSRGVRHLFKVRTGQWWLSCGGAAGAFLFLYFVVYL